MIKPWRQIIKRLHPEGIPWPGSFFYNTLSKSEVFRRHYELVAHDVISYGVPKCILDIGTGPGQLLIALHRLLPDTKLVGVDISPAMVDQAQKNIEASGLNASIEIKVATVNNLPFADGVLDCVVSTGSLHHWKDCDSALSEVYRVLRSDAYALMYDMVRELPKDVSRQVRRQFGGFRRSLMWLHSFEEPFLSPEEMQLLGKNSVFVVEGARFVGALYCLVLRKTVVS